MNKRISKEIKKRSKLRNKFLKTSNNTDKFNYNKQKKTFVYLLRKEKTKYFAYLNIKDVTDNFSDKPKNSERIVLIENDEVVMEDGKVELKLNMFFPNVATSRDIPKFKNCNPLSERIPQPTLRATLKYANRPSISAIKKYIATDLSVFYPWFQGFLR